MPIKDVSELEVYQLALKLLKAAYELAKVVEKEDRELARQLRKTASQIAPLIAEGYAKKSSPLEFKRFQLMAMGTSDEMVTHIRQVVIVCEAINCSSCDILEKQYIILSKRLNTLIRNWK